MAPCYSGLVRPRRHFALRTSAFRAPPSAARLRSIRSMKTTQEIVVSIDTRLRELSQEIKTLDAARSALERRERRASDSQARPVAAKRRASPAAKSSPARSSRKASPSTQRAPVRRGGRASNGAIPADRLESLLSGNGGLTTSALAEQANANRDQVLGLLRDLEAAGRIRRSGQRRGTRWHAITDEDRIRERAAELEATRKRRA